MPGRAAPRFSALADAFLQPFQAAISCFSRATLLGERPSAIDRVFQVRLSERSTPLGRASALVEQLPAASRELLDRFGIAHLPTGVVTLPEILRMTVADLGVAPLERNPTKVAERLAAAEDALRASLAWTTAPSR